MNLIRAIHSMLSANRGYIPKAQCKSGLHTHCSVQIGATHPMSVQFRASDTERDHDIGKSRVHFVLITNCTIFCLKTAFPLSPSLFSKYFMSYKASSIEVKTKEFSYK